LAYLSNASVEEEEKDDPCFGEELSNSAFSMAEFDEQLSCHVVNLPLPERDCDCAPKVMIVDNKILNVRPYESYLKKFRAEHHVFYDGRIALDAYENSLKSRAARWATHW